MSLYTKSDEFQEEQAERDADATADLLGLLMQLFGRVAVRGLSDYDHVQLQAVMEEHGKRTASPVEGFYVREASKASQDSTFNMLRGVLAGSAATARDLTGKEPDPWVQSFVEGTSDLVERDGASVYVKALADSAEVG